jgi:porin
MARPSRFQSARHPYGGVVVGKFENMALAKQGGTWATYYNFDQFLYETDKSAGNGVGLFGRFGASEGDPVPAQYMYSLGVGGKGLIPSRDLDRFGIGYYYLSIANPTLQGRWPPHRCCATSGASRRSTISRSPRGCG